MFLSLVWKFWHALSRSVNCNGVACQAAAAQESTSNRLGVAATCCDDVLTVECRNLHFGSHILLHPAYLLSLSDIYCETGFPVSHAKGSLQRKNGYDIIPFLRITAVWSILTVLYVCLFHAKWFLLWAVGQKTTTQSKVKT